MKITKELLKKLIVEELGTSIVPQDDQEFKYFYLSPQEIKALDTAIRTIAADVVETIPTVRGHNMFSVKPLLEKVPIDKGEEVPLAQVAEGDVEDLDAYRERFKDKRGGKKTDFTPEEEEEYIKLRQQYHGPEGEVSKVGVGKARSNMTKGIGELQPGEFEEFGYVLKVPKEVLDDFDTMVEELKGAGSLFNEAQDWYHSINRIAREETANDRDAALYGLLIATFSPRAKFSLNLAEASFMLKAVVHDAAANPEKLMEFLKTIKPRDPKVAARTGAVEKTRHIGHLKVANFALNLVDPDLAGKRDPETGELEHNEVYRWNSTIDTWMIDAFYPMLKKASTAKEYAALKGKMMSDPMSYTYLSELVGAKAKQLGLLPHELQAIIWVAMKRRQSGADAATTNESIDQIKEAINNIFSIRGDIGDINEELEESNWVHFLFKQIEKDGIQKTAEVVLGGYIEADGKMQKIPGLRSIASRGAKGDQFRYFPDEPTPDGKPKPKKAKKPAAGTPGAKPGKEAAPYADPQYSDLLTHYVLNTVVQMPTGKTSNLYNAISMYMSEGFSTEQAVKTILADFNREATASKDFLQEMIEKSLDKFGIL